MVNYAFSNTGCKMYNKYKDLLKKTWLWVLFGACALNFLFFFFFFKVSEGVTSKLDLSFFLFIYLFIFGCVGSSFLCKGFLQLWRAGATLHHGAWASHCRGLSCCGAQASDAQAQ